MLKKSHFNVFQFLAIFGILESFFYTYIGIISPGGQTYVPFLHHYLDFPAWLTYFICTSARTLLNLSGYETIQHSLNTLAIKGSRGVSIIWACLGFGVMSFWTAFISAHKAKKIYKLKWIGIGVSLIILLNIVRIALIAVANHYDWKAFNAIEPHLAFNIVSYIFIFGLTFLFVKQYAILLTSTGKRSQKFEPNNIDFVSIQNLEKQE